MAGPILMVEEHFDNAVFVFGEPTGETEIYPSVAAAARSLEPWQLEDAFAVDGRGNRVLLRQQGARVVAESTEETIDAGSLRRRAEGELRASGVSATAGAAPLDLLRQLLEVLGYSR